MMSQKDIKHKSFVTNFNPRDMDEAVLNTSARNLGINIWFGDAVDGKIPAMPGSVGLYIDMRISNLNRFWDSYHAIMEMIDNKNINH